MPRPLPLNLSSSRSDVFYDQALTPRTPHTARIEQGLRRASEGELDRAHDLEDDHDNYQTTDQQQAAPLLQGSSRNKVHAGSSNRDASKRSDSSRTAILISRLSLSCGILLALILSVTIYLSIERPDTLRNALGVHPPTSETPNTPAVKTPTAPTLTGGPSYLISYENYTKFPLSPDEYLMECSKLHKGYMSHGDYWDPPAPDMYNGILDVPYQDFGSEQDNDLPEGGRTSVCSSTITYMLDGSVGLTANLALMAQAAALARERNRTFLVDDTYWDRGKWTDHFQDVRDRQPGPEPQCRAPPAEELVACPRLARHWVITARTAKFHFGHDFSDHYEDPYMHQLNRLKPIYNAALESFTSTIRPNPHNAQLIRLARQELMKITGDNASYISVHIRRGDRKPSSWEFHGNPVPLSDFSNAVSDTWIRISGNESTADTPLAYIASDSPTAPAEFSDLYDGLTFSLSQSENPDLRKIASPGEYHQKDFNYLTQDARIDATRGMIVDFAVVGGFWTWGSDPAPEAVICTITSSICRLAAVGLHWDRAFGDIGQNGYIDEQGKRWVEIDQKGAIMPAWQAFELF